MFLLVTLLFKDAVIACLFLKELLSFPTPRRTRPRLGQCLLRTVYVSTTCVSKLRLSLLLAILFCFGSSAIAQSSLSGAVHGTAWFSHASANDASHRIAVSDAQITVQSADTAERFQARTDATGAFRIPELKPGDYSLKAAAGGFADFETRVTIEVGRITEVDLPFSLAGAQEVVEVRGEAPAVNTSQPDFAGNVSDAAIENLPSNGRRWSDFALLTPTTTLDGDFGLISFRGISGLMNNSTVDGADNNQAFYSEERGRTRISYVISQAAVREFQVNTSNFSAEYGRAAGAVINAVTHSGTNHLHGQLFYYLRDNALGATNAFTVVPVQLSPGDWTTRNDQAPRPPPAVRRITRRLPSSRTSSSYSSTLTLSAATSRPSPPPPTHPSSSPNPASSPRTMRASTTQIALWSKSVSTDELYTLTRNVMPYGVPDIVAINAFSNGINYLANLLGPVPRTADHQVALAKIDYHLNPHHSLALSYNLLRWNSPAGVQTAPVVQRGIDSFGFSGVKVDTLTARLTSILGDHVFNQLRLLPRAATLNPNSRSRPLPANRSAPTALRRKSMCSPTPPASPSAPPPPCRSAPSLTNTATSSPTP